MYKVSDEGRSKHSTSQKELSIWINLKKWIFGNIPPFFILVYVCTKLLKLTKSGDQRMINYMVWTLFL